MDRLKFRLASPEDAPKVDSFNQRLASVGETYHHLSVEMPFRTMAHLENSPVTVEKLFCFDGDEIRGGVTIKRMAFRIHGVAEEVACGIYPLSEGIVNPAYRMLGLGIEAELLRRYPLTYGLGAHNNSLAEIRQQTGWFRLLVPFHFAVLRAGPFLRNITYLGKRKWIRTVLNLAANSGAGTAGIALLNLFQQIRGRYPDTGNVSIERFDQWGDWADEIWQITRDRYELIGDRSASALQSLYPAGHEHLMKLRFRATGTGRLIGWAVLTHAKLKDHKYFGNMVLAGLVDMLAVPEDAYAFASGILVEARRAKADLLVVNHSDQRWNKAFKHAGMLPWKTNYYLSLSPELKNRFDPIEEYTGRFFFTRGDGHGPTRLWLTEQNPNGAKKTERASAENLLSKEEKRRILVEWNATQVDYPQDVCLHHLFEAQAKRTPDAVAVVFEGEQLTYRELNNRANRLAHHLRATGVRPGTLVGICVERSLEMVVGLLGILKTGGAYVPLDPAYPQERLAFMLADSQALVLLTQQPLLKDLPDHNVAVLCLDTDWPVIARQSDENLIGGEKPTDRAYVIYTSGSTGKPKGVQIPHRAAVNFLASMRKKPGFVEQDVLLSVTTISFDIALLELFLPIIVGARVVVASRDTVIDGQRLQEKLASSQATVMQATPATWRLLLETGWEGSKELKILCGGEALPRDLANRLLARCASLWNMYGPTETTVWSTVQLVEMGDRPVPIGRPIDNTQVYVLDELLQPVPTGVPGELHIGGDGLALGYLNRPELTAEKFITHPFDKQPGAHLYKTGDLVRYLPDGTLEYLGRLDHQVKIRGFRVELGEIEAVLNNYPVVREGVVISREDVPGNKRLVAYIVIKEDGSGKKDSQGSPPLVDELRTYLQQRLPEYMLPSAFVFLDALPLTPNRKVDRKSLPAPDWTQSKFNHPYVEPRNELEKFLAATWCEVLNLDKLGVHDNFFLLGGDSIQGSIFINKVQQKLGEFIYVVALFDSPTVADFAAYLNSRYQQAVNRIFGNNVHSRILVVEPEHENKIDEAKVAHIHALIPSLPPRLEHKDTSTAKNPPAVFILSTPRSGTTLLRVMLAGNPGLFAPPELELLGFNTLEERKKALSGRFSLWSEGAIRAIMEIKGGDVQQAKRLMVDFEERELNTQEFYWAIQEWIGDRLLVDKSTTYALDIETLKRAELYFEDPLYIYLSRHPIGMIKSFQEVSLDQVFFRYEHPFSSRELAELIWIVCHQNIQEFLERVPQRRQYRLGYEELVRRPLEISQEICRFIGIEFHPDMIQPYKDKERKMTDGIHSTSIMLGDMKFHQHTGIDPELAESWRKSNSGVSLSDITWELAEKLGYPRIGEWKHPDLSSQNGKQGKEIANEHS